MEDNEKADELAEDGAEVDGGTLAAAMALTINQLRTDTFASIAYSAHFHVQVEEWKDRDEIVPKEKEAWQIVRKKRKEVSIGRKDVRTWVENSSA